MISPRAYTGMLAILLLVSISCAQADAQKPQAEPPVTKPDDDVPEETLKEIDSLFAPPQRSLSHAEAIRILTSRMEKVLTGGAEAEKKYPSAGNLHHVRSRMLRAASFLASRYEDASYRKTLLAVANRVLASNGPAADKLAADFFVTQAKLAETSGQAGEKEIRQFAARYAETDSAGSAMVYAAMLANKTKQEKLKEELLAALERDHIEDGRIRAFLRRVGRHPDVGRPFEAELTRLDGTKLTLPDDLKGKVLVIDFWAMWCPPCVKYMPHMKNIYAKLKSRDVEIVGISLDKERKKLVEFIQKEKLTWVHTYTGKFWADPTVVKYGVTGIPSVWVVGRNGKVVSDDARANLEATIVKALQEPADKDGNKN